METKTVALVILNNTKGLSDFDWPKMKLFLMSKAKPFL